MISEVAVSFVVLAGALLLARSFAQLLSVNPGFDAQHVLVMDFAAQSDWDRAAELFNNNLRPAIAALPGVESVAGASMAPFSLDRTETSRFASRFGVAGTEYAAGAYPVAQVRWISEDYFRVLKIPLLAGRRLTAADRQKPVWLINETLARQYFPGRDPVGRELIADVATPSPSRVTIAGVVGDVRDLSVDAPARPTVYLIDTSPRNTLLLRVASDPRGFAAAIREIVRKAAPDAPILRAQPLEELLSASLARQRFALKTMTGFAALAAVLALVGIYGVVSYSVSRRVREFAIRAAIGARPRDLARLVGLQALRVCAAGIVAGLLIFAFAARLFRSMLYQVSTMDPVALAVTAAVVAALATAALAVPVRRAAASDPNRNLREG